MRWTVLCVVVALVNSVSAFQCPTCKGRDCSLQPVPMKECSVYHPFPLLKISLLRSATSYSCVYVEYYDGEQLDRVSQCIVTTAGNDVCKALRSKYTVKTCSLKKPQSLTVQEPGEKDAQNDNTTTESSSSESTTSMNISSSVSTENSTSTQSSIPPSSTNTTDSTPISSTNKYTTTSSISPSISTTTAANTTTTTTTTTPVPTVAPTSPPTPPSTTPHGDAEINKISAGILLFALIYHWWT